MNIKKPLITTSLIFGCLVTSSGIYANETYKKPYTPPSRGFFLEQGHVNTSDHVSIELHSGSDTFDNGGGIRLGLDQAEVILNNGLSLSNANTSDVLIKWQLSPIEAEGQRTTDQFKWALLTGLSITDFDNSANDQTNLKLGVTASLSADVATFTVSPSLNYSDLANDSDVYFELGLGAYAGVIDTNNGLFSIGAEFNITTQDDRPGTAFDEGETSALLGIRWSYNERINIDFIPIMFSDNDLLGIPGIVRLNTVF